MKPAIFSSLVLAATLLSASHAGAGLFSAFNPIRLHSDGLEIPYMNCESWRWAVETNSAQNWKVVPEECVPYVGDYMVKKSGLGSQPQYNADLRELVLYARSHLNQLNPAPNGKDLWVFDLDQTLLSDVPYYNRSSVQFGGKPYNRTAYYEWLQQEAQPAVPEMRSLYEAVLSQGFKIAIISGTSNSLRPIREANLKKAGYHDWDRLILKEEYERGTSAVEYKSKKRTELVNEGFIIVGNVGDQWSDLLGDNPGKRTFKAPNPMYYVI